MQAEQKQLNAQAIEAAKAYMGRVAWPTLLMSLLVFASFVAVLYGYATAAVPAWLAFMLVAALTYMSYTPLHEAVHNNIGGREGRWSWLNHFCGYLMAPIVAVPYESHRLEHFTHHRYTNQEGKDPDFMIRGMSGGAVAAIISTLRFFWVQNGFFVRHGWGKASASERAIYVTELAVSMGWRVAFIAWVGSWSAAAVVLLGYFVGGFFTAYWFAYRPHHPYKNSERWRNTSSLIMPVWMRPLEWFWLGQNLHSIHHLFPRVPFYQYHALHREIEPIMRAQGTPIIGLYSRQPIPPKT